MMATGFLSRHPKVIVSFFNISTYFILVKNLNNELFLVNNKYISSYTRGGPTLMLIITGWVT